MNVEIVPANEVAMARIVEWLDVEESVYQTADATWQRDYEGDRPARGFRCNWDSVNRRWHEGIARVDVLWVDGEPIGFLEGTDILEIRPDLRDKGYGRLLAKFMIDLARSEGRSVLEIEIAPPTAEPFWRRMEFTVMPDRRGPGGGTYAFLILERHYDLFDGKKIPYAVRFYVSEERYSDNPEPFVSFDGVGERLPDGSVQLPKRAYCFDPSHEQHHDYFVRIELDGTTILFDKVKYETSSAFGVGRDAGYTYFVDRITPSSVDS